MVTAPGWYVPFHAARAQDSVTAPGWHTLFSTARAWQEQRNPGDDFSLHSARVSSQKSPLAAKRSCHWPGLWAKNQPWLSYFFSASQVFFSKIDPGNGTAFRQARVSHILRGKTAPPTPFSAALHFPTAPPPSHRTAHHMKLRCHHRTERRSPSIAALCVPMM